MSILHYVLHSVFIANNKNITHLFITPVYKFIPVNSSDDGQVSTVHHTLINNNYKHHRHFDTLSLRNKVDDSVSKMITLNLISFLVQFDTLQCEIKLF